MLKKKIDIIWTNLQDIHYEKFNTFRPADIYVSVSWVIIGLGNGF